MSRTHHRAPGVARGNRVAPRRCRASSRFSPARSGAGNRLSPHGSCRARRRFRRSPSDAVLTRAPHAARRGSDVACTPSSTCSRRWPALGIDDLEIELDAPEPPIMDGSAAPFSTRLSAAGIVEHGGRAGVSDGCASRCGSSTASRCTRRLRRDDLELDVTIDFPAPADRAAAAAAIASRRRRFATELSRGAHVRVRARGRGAAREGADPGRVARQRGRARREWSDRRRRLRWPDEFVRHKALDCVGDLALAGARVRARIVACKPSHRGTVTLGAGDDKAGDERRRRRRAATIEEIMKVLPHRYPFLLVDRILEIEERKRIVGIKNVTINEPFFQGHFPGHPIMPGVLIIEAMAQVGGMLLMGAVPRPGEQGRVLHVAQQREVAAAGEAGRPAPLRARAAPGARHDVQDVAASRRSTASSCARRRWARWCATDERDAIHPTALVDPDARDRRRRRDRRRSRSSATDCVIGDGCVDRAARDARAQRHARRRT